MEWTDGNPGDLVSDLIDVSDTDLDRLSSLPAGVLRDSVRRIRWESANGSVQYAGFQNVIIAAEPDGEWPG